MDANQVTPQESQARDGPAGGAGVSRRRFTRAGLSASVVLGSMASQPVLGAAPYHCTVSGKLSGNISPRPGAGVDCKTIGKSLSYWSTAVDWSEAPGFVKGTLPLPSSTPACAVPAGSTTTLFNGTLGLINAFYSVDSSGTCVASITSSTAPATMYQVLLSTDTSEQYRLGRATVVSLLNATALAPNYPVERATIVAMFNATFAGGLYQVNSTVQWTRTQVIAYLEGLYPTL